MEIQQQILAEGGRPGPDASLRVVARDPPTDARVAGKGRAARSQPPTLTRPVEDRNSTPFAGEDLGVMDKSECDSCGRGYHVVHDPVNDVRQPDHVAEWLHPDFRRAIPD